MNMRMQDIILGLVLMLVILLAIITLLGGLPKIAEIIGIAPGMGGG